MFLFEKVRREMNNHSGGFVWWVTRKETVPAGLSHARWMAIGLSPIIWNFIINEAALKVRRADWLQNRREDLFLKGLLTMLDYTR